MLDLWQDVRKGLHLVTTPTLIFTSHNDHIIPAQSSELIYRNISTPPMHLEQIFLERSYPVATLDYEMEEIHRHSINFIKSKTKFS